MKVLYIFAALLATVLAGNLNGDHEGAQVITVVPRSLQQLDLLLEVEKNGEFDFWKSTKRVGKNCDIYGSSSHIRNLKRLLNHKGIAYDIKIENVATLIRENLLMNDNARAAARLEGIAMEWTAYHTITEIYDWLDELAETYPDLVTVSEIGVTYEGKPIRMIKLSTGGDDKPAIFSESAIHAREWVAPATLTYIINELVTNQTEYQSSLDAVDFYFVPVSNPDGYSYSWESEDTRLWRKTRIPYEDCFGADPNRNFDFQWSVVGASDRPCFGTYHGPYPFSEDCTKALGDQILSVASDTRVYLAFHSAAEEWLRPWGYTNETTADEEDLRTLCESATTAAFAVNGVAYPCVVSGIDYKAGGVTDDWAYEVGYIKYSYTIELRDQGYSFILPPEHIIPSGQEMFAAFQVIFEHVRDNPNDMRT